MVDLEPVAFVAVGRPLSVNRNIGRRGEELQSEYRKLYGEARGPYSDSFRYAAIHHFVLRYNPETDPDAGNINKRFLDALEGVAYEDDHVVRLVTSSVIEYGATQDGIRLEELDLTNVPADALVEIVSHIERQTPQFTYVELGPLKPSMYAFGLSPNGLVS